MTVHKQTEGESRLEQSEEEYQTMFELAGVGVAQVDPATDRFVRVNPRLCQITGYSEE
jgi:PAS domain S-box-containing protein